MGGAEYLGFSRVNGKKMKQNVEKESRKMGSTCNSIYCKKRINKYCDQFDEETRSNIFETFWKLSWGEKRIFVQSLAKEVPTKRAQMGSRKRALHSVYT